MISKRRCFRVCVGSNFVARGLRHAGARVDVVLKRCFFDVCVSVCSVDIVEGSRFNSAQGDGDGAIVVWNSSAVENAVGNRDSIFVIVVGNGSVCKSSREDTCCVVREGCGFLGSVVSDFGCILAAEFALLTALRCNPDVTIIAVSCPCRVIGNFASEVFEGIVA